MVDLSEEVLNFTKQMHGDKFQGVYVRDIRKALEEIDEQKPMEKPKWA